MQDNQHGKPGLNGAGPWASQPGSQAVPYRMQSPRKDQAQQGQARSAAMASQAAEGQVARQQACGDVATETLVWHRDDTFDEASQQTAEQMASKVLRFDPSLGADGAFYFVSPDSAQPSMVCTDHQHTSNAVASDSAHSQLKVAASVSQNSQAQPMIQQSSKSGQLQTASDTACQVKASTEDPGQGMGGNAAAQPMQHDSTGAEQSSAPAQPAFPVQGGGQAGILLRAAAAAAAGCSHELVLAAAGRASPDEEAADR